MGQWCEFLVFFPEFPAPGPVYTDSTHRMFSLPGLGVRLSVSILRVTDHQAVLSGLGDEIG